MASAAEMAGSGWCRHRSRRYRDASQPDGYLYEFNSTTGETRWVTLSEELHELKHKRPREGRPFYYLSPLTPADVEVESLVRMSDGHIKLFEGGVIQYYCDQMKREKWAFKTDRTGLRLLCHLVKVNQEPLQKCQDIIKSQSNPSQVQLLTLFQLVYYYAIQQSH